MKVISDMAVAAFLKTSVTRNTLIEEFFPALISALAQHSTNPASITPPRIVQASNKSACDTTHIFMPCIAPDQVGIKILSGGCQNTAAGLGFQGCVVIIDSTTGKPEGMINAATLTAFRTALTTCSGLYTAISPGITILPELTVFGAGAQALWHIRLALALYGDDIIRVNIVNRNIANARALCDQMSVDFPKCAFKSISLKNLEEVSLHLRNSSIIFGCVPSIEPVIKQLYINVDPQIPKFIGLVGSYKPHMIELEKNLLIQEFKDANVKIVVDSKMHALAEAGEFIQSEIAQDGIVDLAEFFQYPNIQRSTVSRSNICLQKIVGLAIVDVTIAQLIMERIISSQGAIEVDF